MARIGIFHNLTQKVLTFPLMCAKIKIYHGCGIISLPLWAEYIKGGRLDGLQKEDKIDTC